LCLFFMVKGYMMNKILRYHQWLLFVLISVGIIMAHTMFAMPVELQFDPAVEGGTPHLTIKPIEEEPVLYLESYYLDNQDDTQTLEERVMVISDVQQYALPVREENEIIGIRVEHITDSGRELLREWRALYLQGKKVTDYKGSAKLKKPSDFEAYWNKTLSEISDIPMEPEITPVPEKDTQTGRLYRVRLKSYGNVPIIAWYYVPKELDILSEQMPERKFPAIQIMPGWGAEQPPMDRTGEGFITFSLNPRSHGPSKEFFETPVPHHLWNIENPGKYYYRKAYMDCIRGIDFLESRPEVDSHNIGVEGGSQGGAFALATAALDNRVACAVANVPYISNFPDFVRLSTLGSGAEFGKRMKDPEKGAQIRKTLSYIDVSLLASSIQCPTMITVGLQDRVTPPLNGIVAFNRIPEEITRSFIMDPDADHEVTQLMREENMHWYKTHLLEE